MLFKSKRLSISIIDYIIEVIDYQIVIHVNCTFVIDYNINIINYHSELFLDRPFVIDYNVDVINY